MSSETANIGLVLPELSEAFDLEGHWNHNSRIIDAEIGVLKQTTAEHTQDIEGLKQTTTAQGQLIAGKQDELTFDSTPTSGSNNPVKSGGIYTDQQRQETEIGAVAALGAKNHLNVTAQSTGIVTVNADGTLTVNGSSTSNTSVTLSSLWLKKGTYRLSSGVQLPTGVYLSIRIAAGGQTIQVRDTVTEVEFDVPVDMGIDRIWLFVNANTPVDNLTIYPMIRRAEITDDSYAPYAPTNRELYEQSETKITMPQAYGDGTLIESNSNLNTYTMAGLYYATIAVAATLANSPYTSTGFRLAVEKNTLSGAAVFQTLIPTSGTNVSSMYKRVYENGAWGSWYQFTGTRV